MALKSAAVSLAALHTGIEMDQKRLTAESAKKSREGRKEKQLNENFLACVPRTQCWVSGWVSEGVANDHG